MQELLKVSLIRCAQGPFSVYRIPGIVVTARGTILAYFEMRLDGGDWQTRGIGLFRSEDEGVTWSPLRQLVRAGGDTAINNPVMIAARGGRVYFLWQEDYCRGFVQTSEDDGLTFSAAREITEFLRAYAPQRGYAWDVFAFGPGHGIELDSGALLVPIWLANGGKRAHAPSVVSTLTSMDGGATWQLGEIIGEGQGLHHPNETCAFQRSDGSIMLNIRHESPDYHRAVSISPDGLHGFSRPYLDAALPDPRCYGGIAKAGGRGLVAFSNCATNPSRDAMALRPRTNLTVRLSPDDGETWAYARLLEACAGYSDIAWSKGGRWIYAFYEHDLDDRSYTTPRYLTFARLNLAWLTDGAMAW